MIFLFLLVCLFFARVFPGGDAPVHRVAKYADANQVPTSKFVRSRRIEAARPRAYGRGFQLKWTPPTDWSAPSPNSISKKLYLHTHTHFTLYFSRISATKEITSILGSMAALKLCAVMRTVSWIFSRGKLQSRKTKAKRTGEARGKTKVKTRTQFEEGKERGGERCTAR